MNNFRDKANLIWSIADLLRGHYKQADYGKVILPFTVLRRLDSVLEPTKKDVLAAYQTHEDKAPEVLEPILNKVAKAKFHNYSKFDFYELAKDANNIAPNLRNYINGFSIGAKEIIKYFDFDTQIERLEEYDLLYLVVQRFAQAKDIFAKVSSIEMGYIFEELIRKFAELSNETAGEHFTPREVIRLMVNLLFVNDKEVLTKEGIVKTLYDPACGTGGMLSIAEEYLVELNPDAKLEAFGQEMNPESYAICRSDMLIKGQNPSNIKFGDTLKADGLPNVKFDYMLSNPPFGVEWKKAEKEVRKEHAELGHSGRFGAGLPPISDGSFLFLQTMISKMKRGEGGSRIAIVFNGSPLFSGGAESGTSNIRKFIIENDMLEAIIALPDQLFYNTGISTYIWVVTDHKSKERKGKVQLINASGSKFGDKDNPFYVKMLRSLGSKRKEISDEQIARITTLYFDFQEDKFCKIFDNEDFGYRRITIERPLRLRVNNDQETFDGLMEASERFDDSYFAAVALKRMQPNDIANSFDYNGIRAGLASMEKQIGKFSAKREKIFRDTCCVADAKAEPVIAKHEAVFSKDISDKQRFDGVFPNLSPGSRGIRYEVDTELRDYENVRLKEDIYEYFKREVLPHVPDAWIDESKTKIGYEINFTKYFYEYKLLRSLEEIRADILALESETDGMIKTVIQAA